MLCMYSDWIIDGYFDLRVTFRFIHSDATNPVSHWKQKGKWNQLNRCGLWNVNMCACGRGEERGCAWVSQSTWRTHSTLWICERGPKRGSWPELCGPLLSEGCRRPRRGDGFRWKCSEVQNESTVHVLAASHGRCQILTEACVFVTRAVWACVVFGADCAGGGYRMLLVGLGLLADACRASITLLTLCLCSSVGGGCMAPLRTLVDEKKK